MTLKACKVKCNLFLFLCRAVTCACMCVCVHVGGWEVLHDRGAEACVAGNENIGGNSFSSFVLLSSGLECFLLVVLLFHVITMVFGLVNEVSLSISAEY